MTYKFEFSTLEAFQKKLDPVSQVWLAWLTMLNLQEPWFCHLTEVLNHDLLFSVSSRLHLEDRMNQRNHLQCHGSSLQYVSHMKVRGISSKVDCMT